MQEIRLDNETYTLVKKQRGGSRVYTNGKTYLRVGPSSLVQKHSNAHKALIENQFPIPRLLDEGVIGEEMYYREESLGDKRFTDLFAESFARGGVVADADFDAFMGVAERLFLAQVSHPLTHRDEKLFAQGVHLEIMKEELMAEAHALDRRFTEALRACEGVPFVVSHGDFNASNMYPTGVIDFEDVFEAPLGYDIASALMTLDWFPDGPSFEFFAKYRFSDAQKERYTARFDSLFKEHSLPSFSSLYEHLSFCRGLWLAARMHEWPRIQAFRYDLIRKKLTA